MKRREIVLNGLADAVPIACGMLAVSCAMPDSFRIGYHLFWLILFCVVSAVLLSFWMTAPRFGILFGAVYLAGVIAIFAILILNEKLSRSAVALANDICRILPENTAAAVTGILRFDPDVLAREAAKAENPRAGITLILILIAAVHGLFMTGALVRSRTVLLSLMIPLPMFMFSLIDYRQPALWIVFSLCIYLGYALLGNGLRKGGSGEKHRFTLLLAPLLLLLAVLIVVSTWSKRDQSFPQEKRDKLTQWLAADIVDPMMAIIGTRNAKTVDLDRETERTDDDKKLFYLTADHAGVYHLRTHSYGIYRNNKWENAKPYRGNWSSMEALGKRQKLSTDASIVISGAYSNERAVPYAWVRPEENLTVGEDGIRSGGFQEYYWLFTYDYLSLSPETPTEEEKEYETAYARKEYLMQDGAEREALQRIASEAGIVRSEDPIETARQIAAFVSGAGVYTQTPGRIPKDRDFVLYFLTEGKRGYCVHFASATTALLQALGYPARYTVGYYVEVGANEVNTEKAVTKNDEHAWAEVFVSGLGWIPIESTPQFKNDGYGTEPQGEPQTAPSTPEPPPMQATPTPFEVKVEEDPTDAAPATEEPVSAELQEEPGGSGSDGEAEQGVKKRGGLWWIALALVPFLWVGTGLLLRKIRETRFRNADVKRSIPEMTHYLALLQRFGVPHDTDAADWALEAAFSNHRMQAEHKELLRRVRAAQRSVYANAPIRRFLLRWVLYLI